MDIMPFILNFLKSFFPFSEIEEFYLKDMAILIQGILQGKLQISRIAESSMVKIHRTTLSRFLSDHDEFFKEIKVRFQALLLKKSTKTLVVDDTHLERKSKDIPYSKYVYDHAKKRYHIAQVLLTIGTFVEGKFTVTDMLFSEGKSKNDMLIDWLRENGKEGYTLIADSWYSHGQIVESCVKWFGMDMIGAVKSNLKFEGKKIGFKEKEIAFDKEVKIKGHLFKIHEEIGYFQSIRVPMKVVFNEDENGKRMAVAASNLELNGKEILEMYLSRWSIETYFQVAKSGVGLGKCRIRNKKAQDNWMTVLSIAYFLFETIKALLEIEQIKDVKEILLDAMAEMRILRKGLLFENYSRLNSSFDEFIMNGGLSP